MVAAGAAFIGEIFFQIVLMRSWRGRGMVQSCFFGFVAGLSIFTCLLFFQKPAAGLDRTIDGLFVYVALSYCYFHFNNLGETARRIRILRELKRSVSGLCFSELRDRYNAQMILQVRLSRLIEARQIRVSEGRYVIAHPALLWSARFLVFLKALLLGRENFLDAGPRVERKSSV